MDGAHIRVSNVDEGGDEEWESIPMDWEVMLPASMSTSSTGGLLWRGIVSTGGELGGTGDGDTNIGSREVFGTGADPVVD